MAKSLHRHRADCSCYVCRRRRLTPQQRFDEKVERTDGCWLWTGNARTGGYGVVTLGGREFYAHRLAFEWAHGPLEPGQHVCHRCDTPRCVNPAHLFAGSHADNMADMIAKNRTTRNSLSGAACMRGHLYTPENTYIHPDGSRRTCRTCLRETRRRRREQPQKQESTTTYLPALEAAERWAATRGEP
jgi:hypothetical protein